MTRATLTRERGRCSIVLEGHSDTPEHCAAVSTLIQSLDIWLKCHNIEPTERVMEPGDVRLTFEGGEEGYEIVVCGLLGLELYAPDAIQVTLMGEDADE